MGTFPAKDFQNAHITIKRLQVIFKMFDRVWTDRLSSAGLQKSNDNARFILKLREKAIALDQLALFLQGESF